jgi:sterol desaturase/sphingolipid hydroxylase (fatty acid hydroxylase superfamily)
MILFGGPGDYRVCGCAFDVNPKKRSDKRMLNILWTPRGYVFWLMLISLLCWGLERLIPWRKEQKAFRAQFGQDLFWLMFNGLCTGVLLAYLAQWVIQHGHPLLANGGSPLPESIRLLASATLLMQFVVFLVLRDFLEYGIHILLHRVHWMWEFHKLHHSIQEMDWIGNMRFHWMEVIFVKGLTYLPLVILGVNDSVVLWIAVATTFIEDLNHANLDFDWGPLRHVINSPRVHIWHHDILVHSKGGGNFGVVLCVWDWLFGTAYVPQGQPLRLGFMGIEQYPRTLMLRLSYPFWKSA